MSQEQQAVFFEWVGITVAGMALFGSAGYLMGGRISSPEMAGNISTLVQLGTLFVSGLTLPLLLLPRPAALLVGYLPSTLYADLMTGQMPGGKETHSAWVSISVVLGSAVVLAALAIRFFKWDNAEGE